MLDYPSCKGSISRFNCFLDKTIDREKQSRFSVEKYASKGGDSYEVVNISLLGCFRGKERPLQDHEEKAIRRCDRQKRTANSKED